MPTMPAGSVDLLFADPPFNVGYRYDQYRDRQGRAEHLAFVDQWLSRAVPLVAPAGCLWLAIGDGLVADYKSRLDATGLVLRNWCVWHYTFGPHQTTMFGHSKVHLLWYVRSLKRYTFNADAVRVESARQRAGDKRAAPRGRVPGDVWTVPRLPGNARERTGHPCQMPEAVLERVIRACSNPGDVVFDPFAGSGTTLAVAKRLGRVARGVELSEHYAAGIRTRLGGV